MQKLDKYLLVISIVLVVSIAYYVFWGQSRNEFTEDQLISKMFKCPEQYITEEEKFESYKQFGSYYSSKYPTSTMEDILDKRHDFLVKNNCTETLKIIEENNKAEEKYWAEIERQEAIKSVIGDTYNLPR